MRCIIAVLTFFLPAAAIATEPSWVLLVVFENANGRQNMEQASVSQARCKALARRLREAGPFNLTIHPSDKSKPEVAGRAVELQCVAPEGIASRF